MASFADANLQVIFGVTLMAVLGVASITPAFPRVIDDLGIRPRDVGLLITVFTFPGIFLSPILGVLTDRIGRKKILVPSLLLFALGGGACGLVRDFQLLLVMRFVQGLGASPLAALSGTIIGDLFEGRQRAAAMGYNASILSVGTASYPALGGALALFGWYYPFFLPLLALPVAWAVVAVLRAPEPGGHRGLGAYLAGAWLIMKDIRVVGVFGVSVMTFILLYGSVLTYLPILLNDRFGATTLQIGLITAAMSVTTALVSSQMGRLTRLFPEATLIKIAFLFYALALAMVPSVEKLWLFLVPSVVYGVGHGVTIPSLMSLMAALSPMEHRGVLMSLNGMVLRLGQTLGPLVMGGVYVVSGISGPYYWGAAMALAVSVTGVLFIRISRPGAGNKGV